MKKMSTGDKDTPQPRLHTFLQAARGLTSPTRMASPVESTGRASSRAFGNRSRTPHTGRRWRDAFTLSPTAGDVDEPQLEKAREDQRIPIRPEYSLEHSLAGPYTRKRSHRPGSAILPLDDQPTYPFAGSGSVEDPYLVDWQKDEPANPLKWRDGFRWSVTVHLAINCLCPVFTASAYVGGVEDMLIRFYPLSQEVALLGVSLYILGTAFGPLVLAPLSELFGRRQIFIFVFPFFVLFCLGGAVATNIPSILIFRLIAGVAGSGQLAIMGGQIQDIWAVEERAIPGGLASLTPLLGPVLGPIISGFVAENVGYKPIFWIEFATGLFLYITWIFFVPETYPPTLLRRKAARLQQLADIAGTNEHFISKYDKHRKHAGETLKRGLMKPFELLFKEVMVFALSVYIAIVYGILYLLFTAFPYIFQFGRGWSLGLTGLALMGIGLGMLIGFAIGKYQVKFYLQAQATLPPGAPVPPEVRLKLGCVGAILIPLSLFAFAWTSLPQVPWILPILFSIPFGVGYITIFVSVMLYLIDSYALYAASALAANTVMRALFGAAFPLFGGYMYRNLGVGWAGTILAFLSLACLPMPFLFIRYGPYLRRHSKYIPTTSALLTPSKAARFRVFPHPGSISSERTLAGHEDEYHKSNKFSPSTSPVLPQSPLPDPTMSFVEIPLDIAAGAKQNGAALLAQSRSVPSLPASDAFGPLRLPVSQSVRSLLDPSNAIAEEPSSERIATPISARFARSPPTSPSPLRNTAPEVSLPRDHPARRSVSRLPQLHINTNPSARASRASLNMRSNFYGGGSPRLELGLSSPSLRETLSGRGWLMGSSLDLTVPTEDGWRDYEQSLHESQVGFQ